MNTLSYLSLMSQSLVRYDMANDMLKWAQSMSSTSLAKRNFRQLKKFLQNKGYEYTRPYPYKGKERCTVSLLDIVRQIESDNFLKPHWDIMDTDVQHLYLTPILPLDIQKVGRVGREVPEIDVRMEIPDLQELIAKRYGGCTKLEQEEDLPVHKVTTIKATQSPYMYGHPDLQKLPDWLRDHCVMTPDGPVLVDPAPTKSLKDYMDLYPNRDGVAIVGRGQSPQYLSAVLGPKGPTLTNQDGVELKLTADDLHPTIPTISMRGEFDKGIGDNKPINVPNNPFKDGPDIALNEDDARVLNEHLRSLVIDRDVEFAYLGSAFPTPSEESVKAVNQMVIDIIEGKTECNPLDLYGIVTRPHQAQLVSDMRRQTSIENPINDKFLMGDSLKTTIGQLTDKPETDIGCLFSMKSMWSRLQALEPESLKVALESDLIDNGDDRFKLILEAMHDYYANSPEFRKMLEELGEKHGVKLEFVKKEDL